MEAVFGMTEIIRVAYRLSVMLEHAIPPCKFVSIVEVTGSEGGLDCFCCKV